MMKNGYAKGPEDASAKALNAGMDLYGGWNDDLWGQGYLHKAIDDKLTTEEKVDAAVMRTTLHKMKVRLCTLSQPCCVIGSTTPHSMHCKLAPNGHSIPQACLKVSTDAGGDIRSSSRPGMAAPQRLPPQL